MRRQADVKTRTCRSAAKPSTAKKKRLKGKCKAANIHEPAALQPLRAAALPPYRHREEQRPSARSVVVVDQHKRAALPVEKKEERRRLAKQKRQRTAAADDGDGSRQARKNHNAWKERMRLQGVAYTGGYDAAGLPHGNGKMTFKDGDTYEGEYMNGERHGQGTLKTLLLLLIMYITNHDIIYNVHVR